MPSSGFPVYVPNTIFDISLFAQLKRNCKPGRKAYFYSHKIGRKEKYERHNDFKGRNNN